MRSHRRSILGLLLVPLALTGCGQERPSPEAADAGASSPQAGPDDLLLRFVTNDDGTLEVQAHPEGHTLLRLAQDEGGFLRGLVPSLTQDRRVRRVDEDAPYHLRRGPGGVPVLADPLTGIEVDMEAFGADALDLVSRLITAQTSLPQESS